MITYRTHIYSLAMSATAEAVTLALALQECVMEGKIAGSQKDFVNSWLPELRNKEGSLRDAIDRLCGAFLPDSRTEIITHGLMRHLSFVKYWLDKNSPASCLHDPIDIVKQDIPTVLQRFEEWYERQSPTDNALEEHIRPHIECGRFTTALRDAWPVFKTRMAFLFNLADDFDGDRLATTLFGSMGSTAGTLPNEEREGYLHLFKGLYALYRNPVVHGQPPEQPEESSAVIALINSSLMRLGSPVNPSNLPNPSGSSSRGQC